MRAYDAAGTSAVGLDVTPAAEVSSYGTVGGTWTGEEGVLAVTEIAEKPSRADAEEKLRVEGVEDGFLCFFGLYALRPAVFEHLRELCEHNIRRGGEFQLTDALEALRRADGLHGIVVRGRRFDTGRPASYVRAVTAFAAKDAPAAALSPETPA
jgi:UTP--glucose-1-phosphate uridylyltransferase